MNLGIVAILILSFVCQASGSNGQDDVGDLECTRQNSGLFFASDEIYFVSDGHGYLNGTRTEEPKLIKRQSNSPVIAMTYDQTKNTLYYVEAENPKRIYSYDKFFGQVSGFLDQNSEEFKELSIDAITGNVYFISQNGIGFCDFKLKKCARLIDCPKDSKMKSLVVTITGDFYWIQTSSSDSLGGKVLKSWGTAAHIIGFPNFNGIVDTTYNQKFQLYLTNGKETLRFGIVYQEINKFSNTNSNTLFFFDCKIYDFKEWRPLLAAEKEVDPEILNYFKNPCQELVCPNLCARSGKFWVCV